ncbi:MAG TPA: molybdopterin-dependent oxidoreductase [Acidimicrobiales bacterium]|nr:molybdopterin-dependent oxidoreductase [Acidimicrobiales bacterium]
MISTATSRRQAYAAGAVAAGVALAVTEVLTPSDGPSLIASIGTQFINRFAAPLKDLAIALFGSNDKTALEVGIIAVALAVGASLGAAASRRRLIPVVGFAAFGVVGVWAGFADPLGNRAYAVLAATFGVVAGVGTLLGLLRFVGPQTSSSAEPRALDPTAPEASRRAFLAFAAVAGGIAVAGAGVARTLRNTATEFAVRVLPKPKRLTALPATQPFEVDGLTSYVTANDDFYRIDTALFVPRVNAERWTLDIDGLVDAPYRLTYDELLAMDMIEEPITLQCVSNEVGGNLVGNASWLGVPLSDLLERARPRAEGSQIVGRSVDNFTVGFPTAVAFDGRTALVAVGMNGEPLPQRHGYPARLVVAGLYGYVSATKWLREIQLTRLEDFDAYWVPRGWAKEAPIKTASRIDVPRKGARVAPGTVAIAGVAWAPTRGITAVHVRIDDGPWTEARLGDAASNNSWVQWMLEWDATPGDHVLVVRAIDGAGDAQTANEAPPRPDGASGHHSRRVTVR